MEENKRGGEMPGGGEGIELRESDEGETDGGVMVRASEMVQTPASKYVNREVVLPSDVQRLFDLVKVKNPDLRIAFYFGLRNTLVVKNLDQATKIAYKNGKAMWRVVALNGSLIDTSGTMSGGGNKVRKGGMKAVVDNDARQHLTRSETKLRNIDSELVETRKQMHCQRNNLREVEKKLHKLSLKKDKIVIDIQALPSLEKDLRSRLAEMKAAPTATAQQKRLQKELKKEVEQIDAACKKVEREVKSQEAEITKLKEKMMNAGGAELKKQKKAKVSNLEKALKQAKSDISKAKLVLRSCDKNIVSAQKKEKEANNDAEKAAKVVEAIRKEILSMDADAKALIERRNAATAELEEKEKLYY